MNAPRTYLVPVVLLTLAVTTAGPASAQIYNWDTGQAIPDTEGITPGPGVDLSNWNTEAHNLRYAEIDGRDLSDSSFANSWLDYARFDSARLTNANFTGAIVAGACFADTTSNGFTKEQLYSTASYQVGDLYGIDLEYNNLTGWNFAGKNLSGAEFYDSMLNDAIFTDANLTNAQFGCLSTTLANADLSRANLSNANLQDTTMTNANMTDAQVAGASFTRTTSRGFTKEQLYSTASYKSGNLQRIKLSGNNLTGWDFSGKDLSGTWFGQWADTHITSGANLTNASFRQANLSRVLFWGVTLSNADLSQSNLHDTVFFGTSVAGVNLSRADMRGSWPLTDADVTGVLTDNTILRDGHIKGLNLAAGETLPIRDYDGGIAITIDDGMALTDGAVLNMIFTDATWGSTITLTGGFTPYLGGTLRLGFSPGADPLALVGTTFDLFNWNGLLTPGDAFGQVLSLPGYQWDLANLYTTGEVTFTGVPEPATVGLLVLGGLMLTRRRSVA